MHKVFTHIWFDKEAGEALAFYTGLLPDSGIDRHTIIRNTPSGDADIFNFHLAGVPFQAINGGPIFAKNASISLMVHCTSVKEVDDLYNALQEGGTTLIPLGAYHFIPRYAWVQDRWGLHWQLLLREGPIGPRVVTNLLFSGAVNGKAEEAMRFYAGLLPGSSEDEVSYYPPGDGKAPAARVNFLRATLGGTVVSAMDNHTGDELPFNEAMSLVVHCEDQQEIDRLWDALSAVPQAEQCGWLKDRYGVSWQIVPRELEDFAMDERGEFDAGVARVFMEMKKLDIAALKAAKG